MDYQSTKHNIDKKYGVELWEIYHRCGEAPKHTDGRGDVVFVSCAPADTKRIR